jgi:TRAP-type C4-dicarboxylate transport system permease small subunit
MKPRTALRIVCGAVSATALFAIMTLTFCDVVGRKLADHSIPGSLEMTEMLMVVVIFAALPLVSLRGEHVLFDSMDACMPPKALRVQKAIIHAVLAILLVGLAFLMWRTGGDFLASGETTAQLRILKAPFIYGMAVMCGLAGIVHVALVFQPPPDLAEGEGAAL